MGRNYFNGPESDRTNAVLADVGYSFGPLLRCPAPILSAFILALAEINAAAQTK